MLSTLLRLPKGIKRGLILIGGVAIGIAGFTIFQSLSSPAKAISEQVNAVQLVSEQPKSDRKKTMPEKYNGQIRKVAYLTFDDGPSNYQKTILDILAKNEIKATFFMVGTNVPSHKDSIKRLVKEGHYPGLHSMTHNYKKLYTDGQIVNEMKQVQDLIRDVTGITAHLTRCPYGSMPGLNQGLRDQMAAAGFKEWDWTIDSLDWKLSGNPNAVTQNVLSQANKDLEIILLHEKEQSVQALPAIIDGLRKKGYEFEVYEEGAHFPVNFWHDNRL
ncbi:peptidoglycan-N-acetylglucosamine deacetylase [Ectobacillus panaciterrae]|uniref:peptidoglycan-N-acetylglucosamine deacetylase n=1 Tax=Ectobacillus panaciterrae TaxID=363872 RepID=UPI00041C3249|nr:polysaccharide deacetylase family protein [Ectobacillus panaciterrae]